MDYNRRITPSPQRGFSVSRGAVLLLMLVVAVLVTGFLVFRGTRTTSAVATSTPKQLRSGHSHVAARHTVKHAPRVISTAQRQQNRFAAQRRRYAAAIVPTLARGTRIFDGAAGATGAQSGNFDGLQTACTYWSSRIQAVQGAYEGIPHPYLWWSPAGSLHHRVSGVFHYTLGALQNCLEAVIATDSDAASQALAQVTTGAQDLHNLENYARYLATHTT